MRRRSHHDDGGLIDVELVDVAAEDVRAAAPGLRARLDLTSRPLPPGAVVQDPPTPDRPVRTRHVARAVGLGVVVVLVGVGVAANVSEARREAQLRAALEDAPGLLEPLGLIPDVLWTIDGTRPVGSAGDSVFIDGDGDGVLGEGGLRAVDGDTGQVVWSRPASRSGATEACLGVQLHRTPDVVLCSAVVAGTSPTTEVTVLDAATGTELRAVRMPGRLIDQVERDDDAVTALAGADGHVVVVRWDIATGEQRWAYRSPTPAVAADGGGLSLVRWGSRELVVGAREWLTVDLESGVGTSPADSATNTLGWSEEASLANGTTATWRAGLDNLGPRFQGGVVTNPDGSERFALPGPPWRTDIDDRSAPGVLLVVTEGSAGQVQGLDALTGEVRWTVDAVASQTIARLDGLALVRDGGTVVALRIRDGREVWRVPTATEGDIEPLTDGELIVLVGRDDAGRFLAAYRLEDGQEVWRAALADDAEPRALAGRLLVVGPTATTAIG